MADESEKGFLQPCLRMVPSIARRAVRPGGGAKGDRQAKHGGEAGGPVRVRLGSLYGRRSSSVAHNRIHDPPLLPPPPLGILTDVFGGFLLGKLFNSAFGRAQEAVATRTADPDVVRAVRLQGDIAEQ